MKKITIISAGLGVLVLLFIGIMVYRNSRQDEVFDLSTFVLGEGTRPGEMIFVEGGELHPGLAAQSFYIALNPVTQEEYLTVMGNNPSYHQKDGQPLRPHLPVEEVTWYNAVEYCNRLSLLEGYTPCFTYADEEDDYGTNPDNWPPDWDAHWVNSSNVKCNRNADGYRLPTRIEWEFAARGGIPAQQAGTFRDRYAGTDETAALTDFAWFKDNAGGRPHTVGTKRPNELGIYDMSGNVWEYLCSETGRASSYHMGGAYVYSHEYCNVDYQGATSVNRGTMFSGFRVARSAVM